MEQFDVVVIGGGLAGLTAAYELKKTAPMLKVTLLEAKDRLGGRTATISMIAASGIDQWDIGGQWVGITQHHILNLLKHLHLTVYDQFTDGTKLSQFGTERIRRYKSSLPVFSMSPLETFDLMNYFRNIEKIAARMNVADPFAGSPSELNRMIELDALSVAEFARQTCWTKTLRDAVEVGCLASLGVRASRLSAVYFGIYGKAAGSMQNIFEAVGTGAQALRIKGGSQRICELLAEKLTTNVNANVSESNRMQVHLKTVVRAIHLKMSPTLNDFPVTVSTLDGRKISCRRVILAIPPCEATKIAFDPFLPEDKRQFLANCNPGNLLKFVITYQACFWRDQGLSGEIASIGTTAIPGRVHPVLVCYDGTTDAGNAAIVGFLHPEWCAHSMEERKAAVLNDLARYFGAEAKRCLDYQDKNWSEEPFTGGCPVGLLGPGMAEYFAAAARSSVGCIHFAGTETATCWIGYMSGAVQSGLRAAHEVLWYLVPNCVEMAKLEGSELHANFAKAVRPVRCYQKSGPLRTFGGFIALGIGIYVCYRVYSSYEWPNAPIKFKWINSF